jgi:hypothetical protein
VAGPLTCLANENIEEFGPLQHHLPHSDHPRSSAARIVELSEKHDAGHCCSIGPAPAVIVTQIKVEQLFIGRLERAFDPTARNRRF